MEPRASTSNGHGAAEPVAHKSKPISASSASACRTRDMGDAGNSSGFACRNHDTIRNAIKSAYDHSFSRVGDTDGTTIPCRAHQYTVLCGTPDSADARAAS